MSENLSNLLDKNLNQVELNAFLSACKSDPELTRRWQRYHLVQDLLKNEVSDHDLQFDVADNVMMHVNAQPNPPVESESTAGKVIEFPGAPGAATKRSWWPMALAASVLLGLFITVLQPLNPPAEIQLTDTVTPAANISMPHWQTDNAAIEDRLNALLVEHSEFTSVTGMNGLGSYSKVVSYTKL